MSTSLSGSELGSDEDDEVSITSLKEDIARLQMVEHAVFRRFCARIMVGSLADSIFKSRPSRNTRGKRAQLDWWNPSGWIDVNAVKPATGREYRKFRAATHEPWVTDEEVTFVNGLTAGFWSGCIEWGMRLEWQGKSLFLHDETRSTEDNSRREPIKYRQTFQHEHLIERYRRDNQLYMGEYRRDLVECEDGSERFETTFEDPLEWELDEVTPWKYIFKKGRSNEVIKVTPELKRVVEANRDPKVLATREKLFNTGLPPAKARLRDPKVAYELVDSYTTSSRTTYKSRQPMPNSKPKSKAKMRIRFNPSVYVHGDSIDQEDGHNSVPMSRSVSDDIHDGYRPPPAPSPHTYDLYKPALPHLTPGSFRVPITPITWIETHILSKPGMIVPTPKLVVTRKIYKGIKATRLTVRHYEQGCVWHEAVTAQSIADTVLDQKPDWAAKRRQSFEKALNKMGWDTASVRTGVKPVKPTPLRRFVTPVLNQSATSARTQIRSQPPSPGLDYDNDTEVASDLSSEHNSDTLRNVNPANPGLDIQIGGSSSGLMEPTQSDDTVTAKPSRWVNKIWR